MTVGEWLSARTPAPPPTLAAGVHAALGDAAARDAGAGAVDAATACLETAERLLARVLQGDPRSRAAATDLLVADALVTYAFEAASEQPDELPERARQAMRRVCGLAAPGGETGA